MQPRIRPIQPGEPAPAFKLSAVNRDGSVSLDDYLGHRAVLVGLFRGLHCPFCRRQLVQLAAAQPELAAAGVETVGVVNTPLERARLYFRHRPTPVTLAADPECRTHRAFGVPQIEFLPPGADAPAQWPSRATLEQFGEVRINPTGELPEPMQPMEANDALNRQEGFELTKADEEIFAVHGTQLAGHFLIDRNGVVRWSHMEALDTPATLCKFPSPADLIAAARAILHAGAA